MTRFAKFYTAITGGALTWAAAIVTSNSASVTSSEWVAGAGVLVTAVAVLVIPNGVSDQG
jgi:hypothetical protein